MAQRMIDCDLWTNPQIVNDFTAEDKYFWMYLLTNPHNNICGICKVSNKTIANEMGYSEDCIKNLLNRFITTHNLIDYDKENYEILIINWYKFNWSSSPKLKTYIEKVLPSIKTEHFKEYIISLINDIEEYGIDRVSIGYRYPTNTITNTITNTKSITKSITKPNKVTKKDKEISIINVLIAERAFDTVTEAKIKEWVRYKEERKEIYKETGFKSLLTIIKNKIKEHGSKAVCDCIDMSMASLWKGICWEKITTDKPKEEKKSQYTKEQIDKVLGDFETWEL